MKTTNVVVPMPLTACSPCLLTIRKLLPKYTSIQAIHTLQPISADIEYCCLEATLIGLISCNKHASVTLSKAFLREVSSQWNRMQKMEPLATASTWSTWIAMPCEKGTVQSCCHSQATPTFWLTKELAFDWPAG